MNPITYPARPAAGGPFDVALEVGTYYRDEDPNWFVEPKFNGWRAMLHTPTGRMWNRHGAPLTISREFATAVEYLLDCPFEWLDVEGLERRHAVHQGTLIVLDWITREPIIYRHRRGILDAAFEHLWSCGMEEFHDDKVYLCPSYQFSEAIAEAYDVYPRLQTINARLGCTFYEGVVVKRADSLYPIQLRSADEVTRGWFKHRFTTK